MADQELLARTLSEFAAILVRGLTVSDVLHDLAERVTGVLRVDSAGASMLVSGHLRFVTARVVRARRLEQAQVRAQAGPCVDAWLSGETVVISDLSECASSWSTFAQEARESGIVAIAGIPMRLDGKRIGALGLYHAAQRVWSPGDLGTARVLTDMAASYVMNASELDRQRRINRQLQQALDSRIIIEQAKGVLAAEFGVSVDKAFDLMRRHARSHHANLLAVAQAVVHLGLRPGS